MNSVFYKLIVIFVSISIHSFSFSQVFEINNETVTTCGGVFYDDNGGVGNTDGTIGNDYSATSYTYTICPDNPGDGIAVDFVGFSVTQNVNPDNNDILLIYNGDSSGAPLMGNSNDINFSGITFAANTDNPTGCLTFVFIHNDLNATTGGWEANIECITPCSTPYAEGTITSQEISAENGIQACIGELISFADVASAPGAGFTIANYIWDFGDGTNSIGPADVDHIYDEPGEYIATLIVEDNNGCTSTNITPFQILISTIPIFYTDFTDEICLGGTGYIDGSPVQSETWTALPPQVVSGETYLADGVGFQFNSTLNFNFFEEDQVLESCDDLYGINVNMEHSYIGDLDVVITCPDGTEVILLDFPNGGGGGYLGEPIDPGTGPGIGYDYSWTSDATNGTFGEESIGATPLPSGNYSAEGDLCDLVGCPLNGQWTLTIVDNLAADDGNIFEWGIDLNPELFPGVTTFTPEIGLGLDSTWVEGDFMSNISADGNFANITPPALGEYDYTFFASNNFGCTFDTTITVTMVNGPQITLADELPYCSDSFTFAPEITNDFDQGPCTYTFVLSNTDFGFNNSGVDIYFDGVLDESIFSTAIEMEFEVEIPSSAIMTVDYVFSTWGEGTGNSVAIFDDLGNLVFDSGLNPGQGTIYEDNVFCLGDGQLTFTWSPASGLDNANNPFSEGDVDDPTVFTLTTFPIGFEGCATSEDILVFPTDPPNLGENTSITICSSDSDFNMTDELNGNPESVGFWYDDNFNAIADGEFSPASDSDGTFIYSSDNPECPVVVELEITVSDLVISSSVDTVICENGTANLTIDMSYTPADYEVIWNGGIYTGEEISVQPQSSPFDYNVEVFYGDNCISNTAVTQVETLAALQMDGIADQFICLGDSIMVFPQNPEGGMEPYEFTWSSAFSNDTEDSVYLSPPLSTEYTIEFLDACESTAITDVFSINLNPIIPATFSAVNSEGCYPITTQFIGNATDETLISSVTWEFGDGGESTSVNGTSHTYFDPGLYDVNLTIVGVDGCVYTHEEEEFIDAYDVPTAEFQPVSNTIVLPNNTFEFENFSNGNDNNYWTFDAFGTSEDENPEFSFPVDDPASFEVQLIAENNEGCSDTISYQVHLVFGFAVYAPTAFTPDGDGYNEVWKVEGLDIDESDYVLNIWNRGGELVFQSNDLHQAWDGSHQFGDYYVPNGVYSFQILTRAQTSGDKQEITGHILVIR